MQGYVSDVWKVFSRTRNTFAECGFGIRALAANQPLQATVKCLVHLHTDGLAVNSCCRVGTHIFNRKVACGLLKKYQQAPSGSSNRQLVSQGSGDLSDGGISDRFRGFRFALCMQAFTSVDLRNRCTKYTCQSAVIVFLIAC
jgi:hypothetical protein